MSYKRNKTEQDKAVNALQNTKRLTTTSNHTLDKENNEQLVEEESNKMNICSSFKTQYNAILKSNLPAYSCMITYVAICLVGNVVTGVIVFKHFGLQSPSWTSLFETKLTSNENVSEGLEVDYGTEYSEKNEIDFKLLNLNQTENEVSQLRKCFFCVSGTLKPPFAHDQNLVSIVK